MLRQMAAAAPITQQVTTIVVGTLNWVSGWWLYWIVLDESLTMCVVGEPKATTTKVLGYDLARGLDIQCFVGVPRKRNAIVKFGREKFLPCTHLGRMRAWIRVYVCLVFFFFCRRLGDLSCKFPIAIIFC